MSEKREEAQKARKWVQKGQLECNESTQLFLQLLQQAEKGSLQPLPQELKDEEKDELKEKEEQDLKKKKQGKNGMGQKVGFVGLGAMGGGMALALHKEGFDVCGFDVSEAACSKLRDAQCKIGGSPRESCAGSNTLVVMVATSEQVDDVLFGERGAIEGLPRGSLIILCSTVSSAYARSLDKKLSGLDRDLAFLDAPVSGGVAKAADGTLTIMASGSEEAFAQSKPFLSAMGERIFHVGKEAGMGSAVKMVNQLLADVHIVAAAEAMALGARAGLDTKMLYDIIPHCAGTSWMFENRVPHMIQEDYTPLSGLYIAMKDLGIVLDEARALNFPTPLASAAHQQFLAAAGRGQSKMDDASVVQVYESCSGVRVAKTTTADATPQESKVYLESS